MCANVCSMKPSVAYIQRFLKKPNGFKRTQDNLEIRVGSGKTKKLHIFFRWSQGSVRQEDKLGSVTQDTPRADIDLILKKYLELINYYNKGITPDDLRSADRKAEIDETAFQTGRATVAELFQTYFEVMLNDDSPYNRTYIGCYNNHIKPHIGKRTAEDVTRQELQAVVLKVVQADKLTMAKQIASYLPRVWRWGYRHNPDKFPLNVEVANELDYSPVEPRTRVATDEEKRHILTDGVPVIKACLFMGQRVNETYRMEFRDFVNDPRDNWYDLPPEKHKGKTGRRRAKRIYLPNSVLQLIDEHQANAKRTSEQWIWPGYSGKHYSPAHIGRLWSYCEVNKVLRKGDKHLNMRDLRRTLFTFIEEHFTYEIAGVVAGHAKPGIGKVYGMFEHQEEHLLSL